MAIQNKVIISFYKLANVNRFKVANKLGASGFIVKTVDLKKEIESITSALNISEKFKSKEK